MNPRKILFLNDFSYETIFAQSGPTTGQKQSDVEFYGESCDAHDVTGFSWVQKFYMKNLEKVEKIMNIQEYPTKISGFFCTPECVLSYGYYWIGQNLNN